MLLFGSPAFFIFLDHRLPRNYEDLAQLVKNLPAMQKTRVQSLGWEIPWRREWLHTPIFLPGEFHGQRSGQATVHGIAKRQTQLCDFHFLTFQAFPTS